MSATLDALHRLQEAELRLFDVRQRIQARKRSAAAQEKRVKAIEGQIQTKKADLRLKQAESERLDLDVKSDEGKIAKMRAALNTAKTNKEYSSILTQLNTDKADMSRLEEQMLAVLTEIDKAKASIAEDEAHLAIERQRLEELQKAVRHIEDSSAQQLAQLTAQRNEAAKAVPPKALLLFERVADKHEGQALAIVVRINPRREEFSCGGCNMSLTIEQVNAAVTRDEPTICHSCGRILYFESARARV